MDKNYKINNTINKFNKEKKIIAKENSNNEELNSLQKIKLEKYLQIIKNLKSDRKLKRITLYFVMGIIFINILVSLSLIVVNAIFIFKFDKTLYSEKFLGFLLGSQLIVMPFVLLKIITKHLFPNQDK